jgi:hypothetical protein
LGWDGLAQSPARHVAVVVATDAGGLARRGLALARALGPTEVHAVHVDLETDRTGHIVAAWEQAALDVPLEVLPAPYREPGGPVCVKVRALLDAGADVVSVVIAEVRPRWWQRPLYESDAPEVTAAVQRLPRTAVIEDPVLL